MKAPIFLIAIFTIIVVIIFFGQNQIGQFVSNSTVVDTRQVQDTNSKSKEAIKIVAQNLKVPWAIAFLPDNSLLVTERFGRVSTVDSNGNLSPAPVAIIGSVKEIGEGGLLGIVPDPDFKSNNFVYLYYTYSEKNNNTLNRVTRMTYKNGKLINEKTVLDKIPGASNHNGGRIKFGPDGFLYIGTGDAQNPSQAQDKNSLGGKILRTTRDGKIPKDNPFGNVVYSYGHRNVQGLAWDSNGNLWATEHGRSGVLSGLDELNFIENGNNYGWPEIAGDERKKGMQTPRKNSENTTWAPSGAAFVGNSLFFAGLRGQTLYQAIIENGQVTEIREHFKSQFGRIREVILGPDGFLYITTSNKDGRGSATSEDDRIIKINPESL